MAELNDSADLFANSSTETVKENLDYLNFLEEVRKPQGIDRNRLGDITSQVFTSSPMSPVPDSNFSFLANQFISEACNIPVTLYCPFCSFTCHFEFIFKDHVKKSHPSEIMAIAKSNSFYIEFHACPFCHAKFFNKELLPRHVLTKHEDSVIFKGLGHSDYAQCRFCSYKLLQRHVKRLIVHIEKKHLTDLDNFLKHQNTNVTLSTKDMKFFCDEIDELSLDPCEKINKSLNRESGGKMSKIKSILKPPNSNAGTPRNKDLNRCALTPNNGSYEAIRQQNSARRKLRFDLPESTNENKENKITATVINRESKTKIRWFSMFRKDKRTGSQLSSPNFKPATTPPKTSCGKTTSFFTKFHLENDGVSPLTTHHFKCGLCYLEFENNAQLLSHLRSEHRGLSLTAQYRCGACNAKFYRNSYLVRHCWFHHTPLCLKKDTPMDQAS